MYYRSTKFSTDKKNIQTATSRDASQNSIKRTNKEKLLTPKNYTPTSNVTGSANPTKGTLTPQNPPNLLTPLTTPSSVPGSNMPTKPAGNFTGSSPMINTLPTGTFHKGMTSTTGTICPTGSTDAICPTASTGSTGTTGTICPTGSTSPRKPYDMTPSTGDNMTSGMDAGIDYDTATRIDSSTDSYMSIHQNTPDNLETVNNNPNTRNSIFNEKYLTPLKPLPGGYTPPDKSSYKYNLHTTAPPNTYKIAKNSENSSYKHPNNDMRQSNNNDLLIDMLTDAMYNEQHDADYVNALMEYNLDEEDIRLLRNIHLDSTKNLYSIQDIYRQLLGSTPPHSNIPGINITGCLPSDFSQGMIDKIDTNIIYRTIYHFTNNNEIRDTLLNIIFDEQNHATIYSYLSNKYRQTNN